MVYVALRHSQNHISVTMATPQDSCVTATGPLAPLSSEGWSSTPFGVAHAFVSHMLFPSQPPASFLFAVLS